MSIKEIKKMQSEKGFTIVELLIVIVVIGILAAIVIVAFNGIQNRANTTARNTTAENLAKKLEAYNSVSSAYPSVPGGTAPVIGNISTQLNSNTESSLTGSGITIATPTASSNNNTVQLRLCNASAAPAAGATAAGYIVYVWDTTLTTPGLNPVQAGGITSINNVTGGAANTVAGAGTAATTPANCTIAS